MRTVFSIALAATFMTAPLELSASGTPDQDLMVWDGMPLHSSCDKNTITINECAYAVWKKADDELNAFYQQQLQYLRGTEAEYPPSRGASEKLMAAQRAWIDFRDKDCEYPLGRAGGSGDAFEVLKCKYKRTQTRSAELREYIACRYNGCPF